MSKISVVGCGYVGLVTAACFAELGHDVYCFDNNPAKLSLLEQGGTPIDEPQLAGLLQKYRGRTLRFTSTLADAVDATDIVIIAVGTPARESGEPDLSQVEAVARDLGRCVKSYKLIVEKSTVPVLTSTSICKVMELNGAAPGTYELACNPEFLREGTAVTDFLFPERIIIGADTARAAELLANVYKPLTSARYHTSARSLPPPPGRPVPVPLILTSVKSAELIKYACNSFLAMKISFINAIATMCEAVGADIQHVCAAMASDSRIGGRFLNPGIGFGGSGFAKDLAAFEIMATKCGYDFTLLRDVIRINEEQISRFLKKIRKTVWTLRGKKLAVLGLAFKGGTDDIRQSPALDIVQALLREGCSINAYDPAAMRNAAEWLKEKNVQFAASPYEAARGCDALLVLTDWPEFAALDLSCIREELAHPIIIDGRNLYDPEVVIGNGLIYSSVGRADAAPKELSQAVGIGGNREP